MRGTKGGPVGPRCSGSREKVRGDGGRMLGWYQGGLGGGTPPAAIYTCLFFRIRRQAVKFRALIFASPKAPRSVLCSGVR